MTVNYLNKRIAYFSNRMLVAKNKAGRTLAEHKMREAQKQLKCLLATGSVSKWYEFTID